MMAQWILVFSVRLHHFLIIFPSYKHAKICILVGATERRLHGIRRVQPTIMVPLTEMMDHAIPKYVQQQVVYMLLFSKEFPG